MTGLLPAVLCFAAFSVGCLLVVAYQMYRYESASTALLGLVVFPYAFVWGWRNAEEVPVSSYRLSDVMTVWSWCMGAAAFYWLIMPKG